MADLKISALPASTTPLAGTEVLPIVQSSTTRQVSVANLTAGRAVSALSITSTNDASISGLTVGKGGGSQSTSTALGVSTLSSDAGGFSVAIGYQALNAATAGYSTAVGYQAGKAKTSGAGIDAFGFQSLVANTTGALNSGFGTYSLLSNTTGSNNTAVGREALQANTTGNYNTAVGYQAGYNSTGGYTTAVGWQALKGVTTGVDNTGMGLNALLLTTTGSNNTALGRSALENNSTASNNTAVGYQAGYSGSTGAANVYIGYQAAYSGTTGSNNNVAVGNYALYSNSGSSSNTAVGFSAGYSLSSLNNTMIGNNAGYYITSGAKNTILGSYTGNQGGLDIRTASNYIVLSDGDGNPRQIIDNNGLVLINRTSAAGSSVPGLHISGSSDTTGTNYTFYTVYNNNTQVFGLRNDGYVRADAVYNKTTASVANVNVDSGGLLARGTSARKYKQNIRDLESIDINKFRPVRYNSKCENDDQTIDHFGIIADEVDEAGIKELVTYGSNGEVESFKYERLTVILLKEIQDLKQRIATLESK
jgi:hypothetical protein